MGVIFFRVKAKLGMDVRGSGGKRDDNFDER
jgi:hypothetical protein